METITKLLNTQPINNNGVITWNCEKLNLIFTLNDNKLLVIKNNEVIDTLTEVSNKTSLIKFVNKWKYNND